MSEALTKEISLGARQQVSGAQMPIMKEFMLLLRLQYSDYRGNAPFIVLFGFVIPLGLFWVLQTYVTIGTGSEWLVAGNIVMSVCYGSMNFSMQRIAWMKHAGEMDYYGTLPIRKSVFVSVIFVLGLLSSLPGVISNLILGVIYMDLGINNILIAIPVILVASLSLSVIGVGIGSIVKSMPQLSLYFYLSYAIVTFLCPVMVPLEKLPWALKATSYVLPPGQAVLAVRKALVGNLDTMFWIMSGAVAFWLLAAGLLGIRRLDWRRD
ncbi:hypothetical protein PCCS19_29990 [Paenibacillus sp. CCS19]|uniref:ABC transporter permease n=1 Tax=Paenibacillus sp. CCS19 TaxID=3158387 RepID=UPI0025696202|nr:ABC transporter permease [Paenibacillus cellulosilyticus]GMK39944.1 hypothetical protein PCCS19_29990 [Paenibacillus cellulosilyticus]